MRYRTIESPLGTLLLAGDAESLHLISLPGDKNPRSPDPGWTEDPTAFAEAARQLGEYFAGERQQFRLELVAHGTPFQERVWWELANIPYGETISYAELARRVGRPGASRAVGAANGKNPLPIVLPCHRVIGSDGSLTGYGGGLDAKRQLLDVESARAGQLTLA